MSSAARPSGMHLIRTMGGIMERAAFALKAGITFRGKRDLYEALGYKRVLMPQDYRARYERGGLAARIVEAFPSATWLGEGELIEDEDPEYETEFETAWMEFNKRLNVWSMLKRTDVLAGLGQYSVLLIGAPGEIEQEIPKLKGQEDILFLAPYAQDEALITAVENDPLNERFGMPLSYHIRRRITTFGAGRTAPIFDREVHWSRVIHVADLALDDRVFGHSRLERIWNYLDDLDKCTGGGSEAFWLRVHQGHYYKFDPEVKMDPKAIQKVKDEAEEFVHGMRRTMALRGADITALGSDVANFNAQVNSLISLISGATGIPQRILLGSERGELASTQDKENWNDRVQGRRDDFALPQVIRPLVERLIEYGGLPEPEDWKPRWPEIEELSQSEKATVATQWAALNTAAGDVVVLPEEIRDHVLGLDKLTPKQIADATPEPPPPPIVIGPDGKPMPPPKVPPFGKKKGAPPAPEPDPNAEDPEDNAPPAKKPPFTTSKKPKAAGGKGSGDFGHGGRPGEVGGSGSGGETPKHKEGDRVKYSGYGRSEPMPGTITGIGEKNGRLVYDVKLDGVEMEQWGYANQFSSMKGGEKDFYDKQQRKRNAQQFRAARAALPKE